LLLCWGNSGCKGPYQIRDNGLSYLSLGAPMPETGTVRLKRLPVRDTVFFENDFTWRASVIKYPVGKVYVESDFLGQETVNRIRIQSPDLQLDKQFSVGDPITGLTSWAEVWDLTYLEDYGVYDLVAIDRPSVHFLVKSAQAQTLKGPADFPATARIYAIVIM
ncbi:MAG: hypothetical protein AAFV07_15600, partial [Bacteroidota bacterium]